MSLASISPIDGRYFEKTKHLSEFFSEFALIKKRVYVELRYLQAFGKGDFLKIHEEFSIRDAERIKAIEKKTNHDIKAVEHFLYEKVSEEARPFIHFGLTSEDVNNLAHSLLIKEFLVGSFLPKISELIERLGTLSQEHKSIAMLSHTHGQPASPTTVGKEFFVFYERLNAQSEILKSIKLTGKLNGATGNYNALQFTYPEKDWIEFSNRFISDLGLLPNLVTTQVEPKDRLVEIFQCVKRMDNIIMDLDRDMWLYISFGYFRLRRVDEETGSSTMPHKINPIDFENSEGNIKVANALFTTFEDLQISRLQRDLSDSTMMRNLGVAFAHSYLAIDSCSKGLSKIAPDISKINQDLEEHPEILTEAIQLFLRKHGIAEGYEILKDFSRGEKLSMERLHAFIDTLQIEPDEKARLKSLKPSDYVGLAERLVADNGS